MTKKKCVTGCSTRTYREDILLLLNCIAENCQNEPVFTTCEEVQECVATGMDLARGLTYDPDTDEFSVVLAPDAGLEQTSDGVGVLLSSDADNATIFGTDGGVFTPIATFGCEDAVACIADVLNPDGGLEFDGTEFGIKLSAAPGNLLTVDAAGLLALDSTSTCEEIQDCVGSGMAASQGLSYDDGAGTFSVAISATANNTAVLDGTGVLVSREAVQDAVGAGMAASQGITYNDGAGTFDVAIGTGSGNQVAQTASGLFVPVGAINPINQAFLYDEFFTGLLTSGNIGSLGWASSVSGTVAAINSVAISFNHPGMVQLAKGTDTTGRAGIFLSSNAVFFSTSGFTVYETVIYLPNLADGTDSYTLRVGFGDSVIADQTNGIYFQYSQANANWLIKTSDGGVQTSTITATPVVANFMRLRIEVNAATPLVTYYVNGTSVGTIATNLPNAAGMSCAPLYSIIGSAGTAARSVSVDYFMYSQVFVTTR